MERSPAEYQRLKRLVAGQRLPCALVDLEAVDHNLQLLLSPLRSSNKTLRLATKSIRHLSLINYLYDKGQPYFKGLMSYSVSEAAFLVEHGFKDILVAYPSLQEIDMGLLAQLNRGASVSISIDSHEQLNALEGSAAAAETTIPVVIDIDVSLRAAAGAIHLGVRRSPIYQAEQVLKLAERIQSSPQLYLQGLLAYEAQIAGLTDDNPFSKATNFAKHALRKGSIEPVAKQRRNIAQALRKAGFEYQVFNGGGTGSISWAVQEDCLTEVTAGSGFLNSHLFDYYQELHLKPAIFFALQTVRQPSSQHLTCHGGGFVASGEAGPDRLPVPHLPEGLELLKLEGAGEVQTPLKLTKPPSLQLGDPVFFRPAKSGEIAEHFSNYLLVRGEEVVELSPTYRGHGQCFL